ncbi:MAG: hypothetical protein RL754_677 [Bacteroidota bacterium]
MKLKNISLLALSLLLAQCTPSNTPTPQSDSPQSDAPTQWTTEVPRKDTATIETVFTGTYEVQEGGTSTVSFPSSIKVVSYAVRPGEMVNKGQLVATISHPDIATHKRAYVDAKAGYEVAKTSYNRWAKLQEQGSASAIEWAQVQSQHAQAQAALESATAALEDYGINPASFDKVTSVAQVLAPISGQVQALGASNGAFLAAEQPLMSVVSLSKGRVLAQTSTVLADALKPGDVVEVKSATKSAQGVVRSVARTAESSGLVRVWIDVQGEFIYGESVSLTALTRAANSYSIKSSAVLYQGEQTYVVAQRNGEFEKVVISVVAETRDRAYFKEDLGNTPLVVEFANRAAATIE